MKNAVSIILLVLVGTVASIKHEQVKNLVQAASKSQEELTTLSVLAQQADDAPEEGFEEEPEEETPEGMIKFRLNFLALAERTSGYPTVYINGCAYFKEVSENDSLAKFTGLAGWWTKTRVYMKCCTDFWKWGCSKSGKWTNVQPWTKGQAVLAETSTESSAKLRFNSLLSEMQEATEEIMREADEKLMAQNKEQWAWCPTLAVVPKDQAKYTATYKNESVYLKCCLVGQTKGCLGQWAYSAIKKI